VICNVENADGRARVAYTVHITYLLVICFLQAQPKVRPVNKNWR